MPYLQKKSEMVWFWKTTIKMGVMYGFIFHLCRLKFLYVFYLLKIQFLYPLLLGVLSIVFGIYFGTHIKSLWFHEISLMAIFSLVQ